MTLIKWSKPVYQRGEGDFYPVPFHKLMDEFFSGSSLSVPAVNISENAQSFHLELSAPGLNKENFKVATEDGTLLVSAEYKEEKSSEDKKYSRREFRSGSFKRSFTLPENISAEGIAARYENGILTVELPKMEVSTESKAKEVKVA